MQLQAPSSQRIAAEAANALLNVCYEQQHVRWVVETGLVPYLIRLLHDDSLDVQANVAGALQSISFQASP